MSSTFRCSRRKRCCQTPCNHSSRRNIQWIAHLKDGKTIIDGSGPEVHEVSDKISSLESIAPDGTKVIVCANPQISNFFTLVTACDLIDYNLGTVKHQEEERIIGFKLGDSVIEVVQDLLNRNVKIKVRKA